MEPALYLIREQRQVSSDVVAYRLSTVSSRFDEIEVELTIDSSRSPDQTRDALDWRENCVTFRSLDERSERFIENLALLAGRTVPQQATMCEELRFSAALTRGTCGDLGKGCVEMQLWHEMPEGFRCAIRMSPADMWMFIDDADDEAALEAFAR